MSSASAVTSPQSDGRIISLVGVAHFFSHFFQLVLPPLFPLLITAYHVDYTALGLLVTLFYACSGLMQTPAGFLVDRFGANRVLPAGLALLAGAVLLLGFAPSIWTMFPLMALAGIGNSVFHPADYAILSSRVMPRRIARAYSIHTLAGAIGWSAALAVMPRLAAGVGFQLALVMVGVAGLVVAALLVVDRRTLDVPTRPRAVGEHGPAISLLASRPIVMCFVYFTLLSVSLVGLQTFLPTALVGLWGVPLEFAATAVSVYLFASAIGTLAGGWVADRTSNHDRIVAFGLAVAGTVVLVIGTVRLDNSLLIAAIALAGFLVGMTTPSRDMLVRASTPVGSTGRVFGFVYSGLDLGSAITPPILGLVLDFGHPSLVFELIAASLAVTILSALVLKGQGRPAIVSVVS
jgi:FSR family fosmidomycin resistance protein-like MFS transporter